MQCYANYAINFFIHYFAKEKPQYKGRGKLTEPMKKRLAGLYVCAVLS